MSRRNPIAGLARVPSPAAAALLMVAAMLMAAFSNAFTRLITQGLPPLEVVFLRNLFTLLYMLPALLRTGLAPLRSRRHGLMLVRAFVQTGQMMLWTYALMLLPVDKVIALNLTVPIWATIGAVLFLGERVGLRRWSAVAAGIAGGLIILRPGLETYEPAAILPLATAAGMAATLLMIKSLARTESMTTIVLYMGLHMTLLSFIPALFVWQAPSAEQIGLIAVMGAVATGSHVAMTKALALADASALAPIDFMRLPFGAIIGFVWFGELMDFWSWVGAVVIFAGTAYIVRREGQLRGGGG